MIINIKNATTNAGGVDGYLKSRCIKYIFKTWTCGRTTQLFTHGSRILGGVESDGFEKKYFAATFINQIPKMISEENK